MSEFAETLPQNMEYLEKNAEILDMTSLNAFLKQTKKIEIKYVQNIEIISCFLF